MTFAGRTVSVLGAGGFLGAHVTARLLAEGARVRTVARSERVVSEASGCERIVGDANDRTTLGRAIADCDAVFVLTGFSGAVASVNDPVASLRNNVEGLVALLDVACAAERPPKIVFPGSRLSYGSVDAIPVAESTAMRPTSPYGLHKYFCEEYLALYYRRYGLPFAIARITNPYGPGWHRPDLAYNVLGGLAARAVAGLPLTVYGDGRQLRDYLYVDDTVDALLLLATGANDAEVVNIGSGEPIAFVDAVGAIARASGVSVVHEPWPADARSVETGDFVADITRARALGFAPRVAFADGIARTLAALRR